MGAKRMTLLGRTRVGGAWRLLYTGALAALTSR